MIKNFIELLKKKIQKIIRITNKTKQLTSATIQYTATPLFPNKEIMEDAMKRV